jgi:heme/copper-type cytochrome/quinol oxidase subunit 2
MRSFLETAVLLAGFTVLWLAGLATLYALGVRIVGAEREGPLWVLAIGAALAVMFVLGWLTVLMVRMRARARAHASR